MKLDLSVPAINIICNALQALQQQTTEEVARSFTCDQRQPQRA